MKKIPLRNGQEALVDDEDYARLAVYKWFAIKKGNTFVAVRCSPVDGRLIYMHDEVLFGKPEDEYEIDQLDNSISGTEGAQPTS